jgi:1-acyl-sn-glycerol-3-phosphate acyltransferase
LQDFRSNFVDRKDPEKQTPPKIKAALIKGYSVINFPEGTTHI